MYTKLFWSLLGLEFTSFVINQFFYPLGIDDPVINAELAEAYNVTQPFSLEDFTYDNRGLLDVMFDFLSNTSFDGVTVSKYLQHAVNSYVHSNSAIT